MFTKSKSKSDAPKAVSRAPSKTKFASKQAIDTLIGADAVVDGDLLFTGGLRIEGVVHGDVISRDEDSSLVICQNAAVHGNIRVAHQIIDGTVTGNVHAVRTLLLEARAVVSGDVSYREIDMVMGSRVNGNLLPVR